MPRELEKYVKRLFAPIIVFDGFEGVVTEKMVMRVMVERLKDILSETATDYEAMVYLHTASLAAPLAEEWRNVYEYLFSKYYPEEARKTGVYKDMLTETESRKLIELKKWIYKRQMSHKR